MLKQSKVLTIMLSSITIIGCSIMSRPAFSAPSPRPAPAQKSGRVRVDVFYDALAPYGDWFSMDKYGWVWAPYNVAVSWRPYTVGHWVYTDDGCTWDSDEPWGWATYHYGRWTYDATHGWVWVPGEEWAPAWVAWRYGDGYIGWAPLPPAIGWDDGSGLSLGGLAIDEWVPPFWYGFVEERFFFSDRVRDYIALAARNETLVRVTRNVTSYAAGENRVIERGIDITRIEKETGQTIRRYRIVDADSWQAVRSARVRDGELAFYRPAVSATAGHAPRPFAARPMARSTQPPAATDEMQQRHDRERRELEQQQQANLNALKHQHEQELASPPSGVSPDELNRRHEAEQRALEEQHMRERQLLENRQRFERAGGGAGRRRP
jgi:hypothetical protein